jgi:hypothetical protein
VTIGLDPNQNRLQMRAHVISSACASVCDQGVGGGSRDSIYNIFARSLFDRSHVVVFDAN